MDWDEVSELKIPTIYMRLDNCHNDIRLAFQLRISRGKIRSSVSVQAVFSLLHLHLTLAVHSSLTFDFHLQQIKNLRGLFSLI